MSESCPKCGASDWKTVTQNSQSVYKACGNCNYSPWLERAETQNATEWLERINQEYGDAKHELFVRQEEVSATEKPTTLMHGRLNKATRIFAAAEKKLLIAEVVSEVVKETESGQITLLLPGLGLFQFEWGDFNLFKAIAKT